MVSADQFMPSTTWALIGKLALYCRDKLVLLALLVLFGAEMGVMGYCVSIATRKPL